MKRKRLHSRSENMRRIRSRDTTPELVVRHLLRQLGFAGYRLHRRDLPGKPDIVFIKRRKAVLVHGCFWHAHECKEGVREPKSNQTYWLPKIRGNKERDAQHLAELTRLGWTVLTVWECEIGDTEQLSRKLLTFMREAASGVMRQPRSYSSDR